MTAELALSPEHQEQRMVVRIGVVITLVLLGLFSVVYWTYAAGAPIGAAESISYYFGALAALCMSVAMLLAARPRCAEGAFGDSIGCTGSTSTWA